MVLGVSARSEFQFYVVSEIEVGSRPFFEGWRMWPQALGIRRPCEASGPFTRDSIADATEKKALQRAGAGSCWLPPRVDCGVEYSWFMLMRKQRISSWGRLGVRMGLRSGPGEASGGLPESFWELRGVAT